MLTLADVKTHLKLDPTATDEDALLTGYLAAALGMFRTESKRRWPDVGEPALAKASDPAINPPTLVFLRYADYTVLSPDEQAMADQYILLTLGHWYENRGSVAVGLNVTEVPQTVKMLMNLLREPTL
ncbi:phage gp6-like head-tail connector protein [Hymenobacter setariae]|uniref:Phage gp6-like head-tail connector protein n=1 Tax=Hymenobacter setariae TaxID=2594794 RepID=A0A558C318_9BACT|nr:head-tail connector protein [Hymenobacter setariae]TVT43114.1 phage gp6-like head-tail connector protein [Hymenobacter setariae]